MPANILNLPQYRVLRVEEADQYKAPPPKNYGADISTLIHIIKTKNFDPVSTHFYE